MVRTFSGSVNIGGFALFAPRTQLKQLRTHKTFKSSATMLTKLPLALVLLLSASILAAAELRTGVPYYLAPLSRALGGGVAPKSFGNDVCPSVVQLTRKIDNGLPIIFTSLSDSEESVVIDENTVVLISFNLTVCGRLTWANPVYNFGPPELPLMLLGKDITDFGDGTAFRIKKDDVSYKLYSIKYNDGGPPDYYNLVSHHETENNFRYLGLNREESPLQFVIYEAEDYSRMIKSVF